METLKKSSKLAVVETPLMKQYYEMKEKFPDALLLFRVGDFYETFSEDAIRTSQILGITLTRRANGTASYVELAGFPHHAIDTYLPKLVKAGLRVAICEQLENPKLTKKLVKRGITELVTPGLSYNEQVLNHKSNNFLASVFVDQGLWGVAFLDISTGEFLVGEGSEAYVDKLLQNFAPSELILEKRQELEFTKQFGTNYYINTFDDWVFTRSFAEEKLLKQFETISLKGFGIHELYRAVIAAGAIMHYLELTCHDQTAHLCRISRIAEENYVWLDRFTSRNLELVESHSEGGACLLDVMDSTCTPMGARLLRRWLVLPLKNRSEIEYRQDCVEWLYQNEAPTQYIQGSLNKIGDLERLISKLAIGRIVPRELNQLKCSLEVSNALYNSVKDVSHSGVNRLFEAYNSCDRCIRLLEEQIAEDAPVSIQKGMVFRPGIDAELDELRDIAYSGKDYLLRMQKSESERTGIPNLKIGFNSVFGYYLEVSNSHKSKVPEEWNRKQTLSNGERYITEELKIYEQKILKAEERILELESGLYQALLVRLSEFIGPMQLNAQRLAQLDCLQSFSKVAQERRYTKPKLSDGQCIHIVQGRHPVIETRLALGERYVPNDTLLDPDTQQILMITGPNMSGKSALLRQTALIVLLAQIGSYVPAESAEIAWVDRIFTRVGASDNMSLGESTFMVEMNETANILNNLSDRSLILLDEIGRGTSTYDGISIAWAISEHLHEHPRYRAKVMFATHYHELNEMADVFPRIHNYHVAVKELDQKILFLRQLKPGGSEHSFGIHVAKMAGIPDMVVKRAEALLTSLEASQSDKFHTSSVTQDHPTPPANYQLSLIQLDDPLLEEIRDDILATDINTLTPVEALMKLDKIKKLLIK